MDLKTLYMEMETGQPAFLSMYLGNNILVAGNIA
jgi:hypothetical protein